MCIQGYNEIYLSSEYLSMTTTENKNDPYSVLAKESQEPVSNAAPVAAKAPTTQATPTEKAEQSASISVQNTSASVPDGQSWIDVVIKVFIDVLAKIFGQPSPTGGKLPTLSVTKPVSLPQGKIWNTLSGWLAAVGNKLENVANNAVDSAKNVANNAKDAAVNTAGQAVTIAKEQAQWAVDAAKVVGQSAVNVAKDSVSDVVDTAKNVASEAKDAANSAVDSAKNVANNAKDAANNAVDSAKATVVKKDPML